MKHRLAAVVVALMTLLTMVPSVGAVSARFDQEAKAASQVDSSICSGKVAVYIYDLWGFNFDDTHPVKKFCGGGTPSQVLIPNLGAYTCTTSAGFSRSCNNMASSVRTRNMTGQVARFYQEVNYGTHIVTCTGNCDIARIGDYGSGSDNNLSSFYAIN